MKLLQNNCQTIVKQLLAKSNYYQTIVCAGIFNMSLLISIFKTIARFLGAPENMPSVGGFLKTFKSELLKGGGVIGGYIGEYYGAY